MAKFSQLTAKIFSIKIYTTTSLSLRKPNLVNTHEIKAWWRKIVQNVQRNSKSKNLCNVSQPKCILPTRGNNQQFIRIDPFRLEFLAFSLKIRNHQQWSRLQIFISYHKMKQKLWIIIKSLSSSQSLSAK